MITPINLFLISLIFLTIAFLSAIFMRKATKRVNEVYSVDSLTPLPLIDNTFVFNGDQFYYPETRHRYLATGDEWIDISEHFGAQEISVNG